MKRRRAFKGLAILPLPLSLTLFKGAPSASAAVGLSAIGGGAAVGGGAVGGGIAAKVAIAVVAVTVAGGAGYEGVQQTMEPTTPAKAVATKVAPANASPAKTVAAKVARVKQLPGKVAAKKADHAKAKAAKAAAMADTATKRARTPVPTGRPASSRSETAKLPGTTAATSPLRD